MDPIPSFVRSPACETKKLIITAKQDVHREERKKIVQKKKRKRGKHERERDTAIILASFGGGELFLGKIRK